MNALPGIPYLKTALPRQQSVVHKLNAEHQGASLSRLQSLSPRDAVLRSDDCHPFLQSTCPSSNPNRLAAYLRKWYTHEI